MPSGNYVATMRFELSEEGASQPFYICDQTWNDLGQVDMVFLQKYVAEALVKLGLDKAIAEGKLTKDQVTSIAS